MKNTIKSISTAAILAGGLWWLLLLALPTKAPFPTPASLTPAPVAPVSVTPASEAMTSEANKKKLGDYTLKLMTIVETRLSVVRRNSITRSIIDVVGDLDMTYDESAGFVVLVAIESKFDPSAKSSAGAVGLTQVIPKYAKEFGLKCGVKELTESDLIDPYVNILIGACRYRALLEILGNTSAALVAYNAGLHSNQLQQLKSLTNITSTETSSYVAKWLYLREKADEKTTKVKDE